MDIDFVLLTEDKFIINRAKGSLLGLAIGDAIGTTVEFQKRDSFDPLTDMIGGGPFDLNPGEWTDDTSMALCLGYSLFEKGLNLKDQLDKYCLWYKKGLFSSNGKCFDIGISTREALDFYIQKSEFIKDVGENAGNGSIMRLAPVALYFSTDESNKNGLQLLLKAARLSSITTHPNEKCIESCAALALIINRALNKKYSDKDKFLDFEENDLLEQINNNEVKNILKGSFKEKTRDDISSSGYVLHSLEAALWSFYNTNNFRDAILLAANLGHDADTIAAICGQISGAYYSYSYIPVKWLNKLKDKNKIEKLAEDLMI